MRQTIPLSRRALLSIVVQSLRPEDANDLPAIRQAINDTADAHRKDGYTVQDFEQTRMVKDVQRVLMGVSHV